MPNEVTNGRSFDEELDSVKQLLAQSGQPEQQAGNGGRSIEKQAKKGPEEDGGSTSPAFAFYEWIHDLAVCLIFVTIFFVFVVRLVGVVGSSMVPTLSDGSQVALLSNFFYHDIENGDVVVLRVPSYDDEQAIVKRVIATEGQTLDIDFDTGTVTVDGVVLDEPYINEQMTWPSYMMEWEYPITIEEGCIFVMGDNRNHSADSRYPAIGMVDTRYVLGKVVATLWPFSEIGTVE